jgi:hypothetical protein
MNILWLCCSDGLRESNVTTKYFDVNDMYSENYPEYSDEYSDNEQSFNRMDKSPVNFFRN